MSTHAAARLAWSRCTLTVTYLPSATDLRTHLRSAILRCGWPGSGPRVGVTAVPTSFGSERFYELCTSGVLRSSAQTWSADLIVLEATSLPLRAHASKAARNSSSRSLVVLRGNPDTKYSPPAPRRVPTLPRRARSRPRVLIDSFPFSPLLSIRDSAIVPTYSHPFFAEPRKGAYPYIREHHSGRVRCSTSLKLRIFSPLFTGVRGRVILRTSS
jgi:hypothetical protein